MENRPKPTTICRTAWRQLERFATTHNVLCPAHVTPKLMAPLVDHMREERLAAKTINDRLRKIRAVYDIAVGKEVLQRTRRRAHSGQRPEAHARTQQATAVQLRDSIWIFGSAMFAGNERSEGQSGEASYWIPAIMHYTGARPEEIAGLLLDDVRNAGKLGWYLPITDLPASDDGGLVPDDEDDADGGVPEIDLRRRRWSYSRAHAAARGK